MSTIDQIESAILQLPPDDFQRLHKWIQDLDYQRWDEQLAKDIAAGKLDALAEEALRDFQEARTRLI